MNESNTSALNEMLKRVHDKKKYVIPNLFRNLEFGNDNELIAFVLDGLFGGSAVTALNPKQVVSLEEVLMSRVIQKEPLTRLLEGSQ